MGGSLAEQRPLLEALITAHPLPAGIQASAVIHDAVAAYRGLLDDPLRVAHGAAAADVSVTLEATPGMPHVLQGFAADLDEGAAALHSAGAYLRIRLGRTRA